jgi:pimeloyl-ACP methyl ester carboxylesterase
MVEFRTEELLAAVESMISLNTKNIPALTSLGVSFVGKLDTNEVHYMGHSFGASTALDASLKRPPASVIAHDPVSGWLPNRTRFSLFETERLEGSVVNYSYYWVDDDELAEQEAADLSGPSVHDINTLILFSHEWHSNNWEGTQLLHDMYQRNRFGPEGGIGRVKVIDGAHHNEFSDTSMLTPTWLARETGMTGSRNPLDTAWDIRVSTLEFLRELELQ